MKYLCKYTLLCLAMIAPLQGRAQDYQTALREMLTSDMLVEGHQCVDLGLPSGTLWATCNIGASVPEESGDYVAWAETRGLLEGKNDFGWDTYAWCSTSSLNASTLIITKYCDNMVYGIVDHRLEIEAADDAACALWGSDWAIPNKKQVEELLNKKYTSSSWTAINGVMGRLITSKMNGRCIFLPAAGCYYGRTGSDVGYYGCYWTSTMKRGKEDGVYVFYMDHKGTRCEIDQQRFCGRSVRPVVVRK